VKLHIGTFFWGNKYPRYYVERLEAGVARNMTTAYRFHVWRPHSYDEALTAIPGCLCRLRAFSPEWQGAHGIEEGDRIVCLDLDLVVTGSLDRVFERPEPFVILQGVNSVNPNPFNGSVWSLRAGYRPEVWSEFTLDKASKVPWFAFPDDQAWVHYMMPEAAAFGPRDGVYAFQKPGWPTGSHLPANARIVAFPGSRDPLQFMHLEWVRRHWR
jgi:hypothetical protein